MKRASLVGFGLLLLLASVGRAEDAPAPKPLTFKVPKGWQADKSGLLTLARFRIGEGDRTASMTVTELRADGGGLVPNVNRWRAQLGLAPQEEADVLKSLRPVRVDDIVGHRVDLSGPKAAGKEAVRTLAAVVGRGDRTWFFKLTGPADLVGEQKAAFEGFLKSVRFGK